MKPAKFNAGGLLKEMKAGIKAVAKEAGVNRGYGSLVPLQIEHNQR